MAAGAPLLPAARALPALRRQARGEQGRAPARSRPWPPRARACPSWSWARASLAHALKFEAAAARRPAARCAAGPSARTCCARWRAPPRSSFPRCGRSRSRACCSRRWPWARRWRPWTRAGPREILGDGGAGSLVTDAAGAGRRRRRGSLGDGALRDAARARRARARAAAFSPGALVPRYEAVYRRLGVRVALLEPLRASAARSRAAWSARSTTWPSTCRRRGVETVLFTRPATREGVFPGEVVTRALRRRRRRARPRAGPHAPLPAPSPRAWARRWRRWCARARWTWSTRRASPRSATAGCAPRDAAPARAARHEPAGHGGAQGARASSGLALTRLRALSREAARLADRVVATDEATRDGGAAAAGRGPGDAWSCCPTASTSTRSRAATPPDRARGRAEAPCPRCAARRSRVPLGGPARGLQGLRRRAGGARPRSQARGRAGRRAGPGWWSARARDAAGARAARLAPASRAHVQFAGRVERDRCCTRSTSAPTSSSTPRATRAPAW